MRRCGPYPKKRIRLEVTWIGACSEADWCDRLTEMIEDYDHSQSSRVALAIPLTSLGTTRVIDHAELVALGYKPKKPGLSFWQVLRWWVRTLFAWHLPPKRPGYPPFPPPRPPPRAKP